jgi:hypothetical protein
MRLRKQRLNIPDVPGEPTYKRKLRYAASWTFAFYAPTRGPGLTLTYNKQACGVTIYQFHSLNMCWESIATFSLNRDVHFFVHDGNSRMRLLGWRNKSKKRNTCCYFDVQFENNELFKTFRKDIEKNAHVIMAMAFRPVPDMIAIFRKVPEMAAAGDPVQEGINYFAAATRDYRPELADATVDSVHHYAEFVDTDGTFVGFTDNNARPIRWNLFQKWLPAGEMKVPTKEELGHAVPKVMASVIPEPVPRPILAPEPTMPGLQPEEDPSRLENPPRTHSLDDLDVLQARLPKQLDLADAREEHAELTKGLVDALEVQIEVAEVLPHASKEQAEVAKVLSDAFGKRQQSARKPEPAPILPTVEARISTVVCPPSAATSKEPQVLMGDTPNIREQSKPKVDEKSLPTAKPKRKSALRKGRLQPARQPNASLIAPRQLLPGPKRGSPLQPAAPLQEPSAQALLPRDERARPRTQLVEEPGSWSTQREIIDRAGFDIDGSLVQNGVYEPMRRGNDAAGTTLTDFDAMINHMPATFRGFSTASSQQQQQSRQSTAPRRLPQDRSTTSQYQSSQTQRGRLVGNMAADMQYAGGNPFTQHQSQQLQQIYQAQNIPYGVPYPGGNQTAQYQHLQPQQNLIAGNFPSDVQYPRVNEATLYPNQQLEQIQLAHSIPYGVHNPGGNQAAQYHAPQFMQANAVETMPFNMMFPEGYQATQSHPQQFQASQHIQHAHQQQAGQLRQRGVMSLNGGGSAHSPPRPHMVQSSNVYQQAPPVNRFSHAGAPPSQPPFNGAFPQQFWPPAE